MEKLPKIRMVMLIFLFLPSIAVKAQSDSDPLLSYHNCSITEDTYSPNSTFHQNIERVLADLTIAASTTNSSFHNTSFGQNNERVYALYLCRGDLTSGICSSCIRNITRSSKQICPNQKESILWSPECLLRYANRNIFSKKEESPSYYWIPVSTFRGDSPPPPSPAQIGFNLSRVVYDLISQTAFGTNNSLKVPAFATREDNITGGWYPQVLYSLAQCTPDISQLSCHDCLTRAYTILRSCCSSSIQALVYFPSCHLRYDVQKFFSDRSRIGPNGKQQPLPGETSPRGAKTAAKIAIPSVVGVLLFSGLCCFVMVRSGFLNRWNWKVDQVSNSPVMTTESLQFDFDTIKAATDNFSAYNKLGQGGFGTVYKGRLQKGQEIAVKRLSPKSRQGIHEFKTEVLLVAKLQHKNLVRLLGFCVTGEEKLLVYEFLPSSSLDRHLFDPQKAACLDWETRYKIIAGIARGLLYLHEDSRLKIVHRDLKPSNILLDKDMSPKISDFGMAKLFGEDESHNSSKRIVGTRGYMAPECVRTGQTSTKSDVYSFGVIILEIVSGQRLRDSHLETSQDSGNLLQWAWRLWKTNESVALMDSTLSGKFSVEEATRCIHIALSCVQEYPERRPTMVSIVTMLNTNSSLLSEPLPARYYKSGQSTSEEWLDNSASAYSGAEDITTLIAR